MSLRVSLDTSAVPASPAGAGRYVVELARGLARRSDLELVLLCRTADRARWEVLAPGARVLGIAPESRALRLAWEQVALPAVLRRLRADCHHGPHYTMPEAARLPKVVTIHDLTFLDHPEWHEQAKVPFFRRAMRVAAAHADALVCVSGTTASRLDALLAPVPPVYVVPHAVDHERFRPEPGPADDRALESIGIRPPYVLFVGTFEPRKDVPSLVRAFDQVAGDHPGTTLVLAGVWGWGSPAVEEAVAQARHRSRIVRTGYVDDQALPALLRSAAAVAYPSLEEGFGLPALEALACGAPLVTTVGTAMAEVAGDAALLVDAGDASDLASALDRLLSGDGQVDERRRRGLSIAAGHTWESVADRHAGIYRDAASGAGRGRGRPGETVAHR